MKSIAFIIVAFNSVDHIENCIDSIIKHTEDGIKVEIIVVDNSDEEAAVAIKNLLVRRFDHDVVYHATGRNIGYGAANNVGVRISKSEIICIINPDVRLTEPFGTRVLNRFKSQEDLVLLGLRQRGGVDLSYYFYPNIYIPLVGNVLLKLANRLNFYSSKLFFPSGALAVLRKDGFSHIGGYDENFFLYYEDADLSRRLVAFGYGVDIDFSISYRHLIDMGSRRKRSPASKLIEEKSLIYYLTKHRHYFCWHALRRKIRSLLRPVEG